jgi:Glycosyltransferase family 87
MTRIKELRSRPYAQAIEIYLALRLLTALLVSIGALIARHSPLYVLRSWDGTWYNRIVLHGYPHVLPVVDGLIRQNTSAFSPLWPMLIRYLSWVTFINPIVLGLFLSALTGLLATLSVAKLTERLTDRETAERAALLFVVAPGAFIFSMIYCEGLLITLMVFAVLALMDRRWWRAGVLAGLATLTSPAALPLVVPFAYIALKELRNKNWQPLFATALVPTGFIGFLLFLWHQTGQLLAWNHTEHDGWGGYASVRFPFHVLANFLFDPIRPTLQWHMLFWCTLFGFVALWLIWKSALPTEIRLLGVSFILLFLCSHPVGFRPRFWETTFPLVMALAMRYQGEKYRRLVILSTVLLVILTVNNFSSPAIFP